MAQTAGIAAHGSFATETLQRLEILLDEAFRIPGTRIRFGLDGIIGLVPGLGDVVAGLLSLIIPLAAWIRGVPYITLVRMAANLGIGVLVGTIPMLGDMFDIAWKANRRNYQLFQRHLGEPHRHTWRDWVFSGLLACVMALVFAIPCCWWSGCSRGCSASEGSRIGHAGLHSRFRDTIKEVRRGVAQSGSASALGAEGRGFESLRPDH